MIKRVLLLALCLMLGAGALAQGEIILVGETHAAAPILDRELEMWDALYQQGARHLFIEYPYYTGELLNAWMAAEDDDLLYDIFDALEGTAAYSTRVLRFFLEIKARCPETVFHGTDVGHQYRLLGGAYQNRLAAEGLEGSEAYARAQEVIEQGRRYYADGDAAYRENAMAENFIRAYAGLEDETVMGIYGNAHTTLGAKNTTGEVDNMATQLHAVYGDRLRVLDLTPLARDIEPLLSERVTIGGRDYAALYYGQQDLSAYFEAYQKREFWQLADAYDDFRDCEKVSNVLPEDNYPMRVSAGQVYMIDYTLRDGTVQRMLMRCDGDQWEGLLATWEIQVK